MKINLDTGAAVNTFPLNFGPEEAGDGRFYRTACVEWIPDGRAWQFQGYDENGLLRSLNGCVSVLSSLWRFTIIVCYTTCSTSAVTRRRPDGEEATTDAH